ncbi:SPOR domain-containing protein [Photobacterium kagoshimensis]|uniref:SPOR domain-containing protein n=1 Tax=Photobacterium kagoshimensis TaxID=2910242 RepID=UPI003D11A670
MDSQIQLLSRLQFLTRFSSNLIQVSGHEGAGKTWLAQCYLETWAKDSKQALLLCHPSQSDAQHRTFILNQLVPSPLFNEQDPLLQSLDRMLGDDKVQLLLVIDDAHLLSPTMIAELWALVVKAQSMPHWQVNVLLFSQTGRLNKYLSQVSHGQGQTPLELEIGDFSEAEVQMFVEVMFTSSGLDATARRQLREQAMQVEPRPGALVRLNDKEDQGMVKTANRKLSPALLVTLLAVVVGAAAVWLFLPDSTSTSPSVVTHSEPTTVPLELTPLREVSDAEPLSSHGLSSIAVSTPPPSPSAGVTFDDSSALPPEVKVDGLTVGRRDEGKRIVVPAELVDGLLAEQALGGSGEKAVQTLSAEQASETGNPSQDRSVPSAPAGVTTSRSATPAVAELTPRPTTPVAQPAATPSIVLGSELKRVPARQYALQLAALRSLPAARNFIADHAISNIAHIYETRRSNEPWFIVVTGEFNTVAAARRAEQSLPNSVKAGQPWVKSYSQIHREIDRVK